MFTYLLIKENFSFKEENFQSDFKRADLSLKTDRTKLLSNYPELMVS